MTRTLREQINEMVQIVLAEGATDNRDAAAFHLMRAGFRPRLIAACLDSVMDGAREMQRPNPANVFEMPRRVQ